MTRIADLMHERWGHLPEAEATKRFMDELLTNADFLQTLTEEVASGDAVDASILCVLGYSFHLNQGVEQGALRAFKLFQAAAELDHAEAQHAVATYYLNGDHIPQDHDEAFRWCSRAAQQDHAAAQATLSHMLADGTGTTKDLAASFKWARKSATQACPSGQYVLGEHYRWGLGVKKNGAEAAKWFERAAAQGHADAKTSLAFMLLAGEGLEQDSKRAAQLYEEAAKEGDALAQLWLCGMPFDSAGGARTAEEKMHWLREAARQEFSPALYVLALRYQEGEGVARDHEEAERLLLKAAHQQYPSAMFALFEHYSDTLNPHADRRKALHWLHQAASPQTEWPKTPQSQSHAFAARAALAEAYDTGTMGLAVDKARALAYRRLAMPGPLTSERDHADVVYKIAAAHEHGTGTPRNPEAAAGMYEFAAELNHPEAAKAMARAQKQAQAEQPLQTPKVVRRSEHVELTTHISGEGVHINWRRVSSWQGRLLGFRTTHGFPEDSANERERGTRILMTDARQGEEIDRGVERGQTYFYTFVIKTANPDYRRSPDMFEQFATIVGGRTPTNTTDEFFYTNCDSFQIRIPAQTDPLAELAQAKQLIEAETGVTKAARARDALINPEMIEIERQQTQFRRLAGKLQETDNMRRMLRERQAKDLEEVRKAMARGEISEAQGRAELEDIHDRYQDQLDRL